ncbi:MAG: cation transporter [Flavobacteriales bacterium]|nr:cation transporter [Flavobacteriales bacterium]
MMALAVFGLVMNGAAAWMLHRGSSLNERGAYLHPLEDVLGWAAVLVGAVAMYFTGWAAIDPLLSMAISAFIAVNALRTLRTGTGILMQRLPEHVDAERIRTALTALPHVRDVRHQHAWSLDGNHGAHCSLGGGHHRCRPPPRREGASTPCPAPPGCSMPPLRSSSPTRSANRSTTQHGPAQVPLPHGSTFEQDAARSCGPRTCSGLHRSRKRS